MKTPIQQAVEIAGGQTQLARLLGVSQPRVFNWLKKNKVTPQFVIAIEQHTGISRHDLRPDVYPRET